MDLEENLTEVKSLPNLVLSARTTLQKWQNKQTFIPVTTVLNYF
jgi:hypothetical protein